jgi:hypothetical protein
VVYLCAKKIDYALRSIHRWKKKKKYTTRCVAPVLRGKNSYEWVLIAVITILIVRTVFFSSIKSMGTNPNIAIALLIDPHVFLKLILRLLPASNNYFMQEK